MIRPYNVSLPVYKHADRVRLSNKFDSLKSSIIEDVPANGKNLKCNVIDLTPDVKDDLKLFLDFARWTNESYFGFHTFDWPLSVNWNTYGVGNEYLYHVDFTGSGFTNDIKLTVIADLSTEPYEGGELEIYWEGREHVIREFGPGTILVFPSFIHHRVKPVKEGVRKSLSMWWTGPSWR
jgi:PKHD-type hydroxylase